jgi:hypothetical protein
MTMRSLASRSILAALLLSFVVIAVPASAELVVSDVRWETIGGDVHFSLQFHNDDPANPSPPVSGEMSSQPFGAFVQNFGPIGTFNVPSLAPDSFFDIFFDVALADLPPSAETIMPGTGAGTLAPGVNGAATVACPPPNFWNGNVDILWTPPGTGAVNYHFGQLQICPGAGPSYIHVILDCSDPAGISWNFSGTCPGWTATLVVTDPGFIPGGPAPNPIPAGPFDGWICVSADNSVPVGSLCQFDLNLTCGGEPAVITVDVEACDWGSTPVEEKTWGAIKALYGN